MKDLEHLIDEVKAIDISSGKCEPARNLTREVDVGGVSVGAGAPVRVQSMLNAPSDDVRANLAQIDALEKCGCEICRMAIPSLSDIRTFEAVCGMSGLPIVADIHFDASCAIAAARSGASALRINPGNIGGLDATNDVIDACREAHIPIRIGVNAGSLDEGIKMREDLSDPEKLALSAIQYVRYFEEEQGFSDIVVSAKAHDVLKTIDTYRLLSRAIPHIPLHIGVTEAGTKMQGLIKSASGLGILLNEGIGDTLRISLTDDPAYEVQAAWQLLGCLGLRSRGVELISCPTCGRCKVDLISIASEVERTLAHIDKPIKVAVMGCVVNGPGEAKDADVGIACGQAGGVLFSNGKIKCKVGEAEIIDALLEEIQSL